MDRFIQFGIKRICDMFYFMMIRLSNIVLQYDGFLVYCVMVWRTCVLMRMHAIIVSSSYISTAFYK